ncbi:MAG TPA: TetR family transcriptional regulator [Pseudonocardiaceae bacterium]|jgi:AcrR family transcriptional regulator
MPRDAEATRVRLIEAAIKEFAEFGIAGGRVDRIAEYANANKAQIYHYFGSKDQMFDAAFAEISARVAKNVPFDPRDLPGYATKLADLYQNHPEILRMATWQRLERPSTATNPRTESTVRGKLDAIQAVQQEGVLSDHYPPEVLLALVLNIASTWAASVPEVVATLPPKTRGQHIANAVQQLLAVP